MRNGKNPPKEDKEIPLWRLHSGNFCKPHFITHSKRSKLSREVDLAPLV